MLINRDKMIKQKGLTLIEIMIALMLGIIVIGATLSVYITTIKNSNDTLKSARLNHDLGSTMSLIMNDIKRSGFSGGAVIGTDSRNNPFTSGTATDIQIHTLVSATTVTTAITTAANLPGNCILYTYDTDNDGVVDDNERYGFRLNDNSIDIRLTGTTNSDCSNTGGTWRELITGDDLNITTLQFSTLALGALSGTTRCLNTTTNAAPTATTCVMSFVAGNITAGDQIAEKRVINIVLTGQLDDDTTVSSTKTGTVQVRNDRIFEQ